MFFQRAAVWCKTAEQMLPTRLGVLLVKKVAGSGKSRYRQEGADFKTANKSGTA